MALNDNERLQEFVLVTGDKLSLVSKKWWYALVIVVVGAAPLYFLAKAGFTALSMRGYDQPQLISTNEARQPLKVTGKGILDLGGGSYAGYAKVSNIEHEWGVPAQTYTAEFKTLGGTLVTKISGTTFILPASEKLIVFSRFTSLDKKPEELLFTLEASHYNRKPQLEFIGELERVVTQNLNSGLIVSAGIKNMTPFTIKQVNLPVAVFDNKNQIVAVNFTYVDDLLSGETRTFQYSWSEPVAGALRSEIKPEVNIFDRNAFQVAPGVSPFDNLQE